VSEQLRIAAKRAVAALDKLHQPSAPPSTMCAGRKEARAVGENRWLHRPSGTICERVGQDRDANGRPYVVMQTPDGARARIDPLALFVKDGDWQKVEANHA
jgi:hypothetical protein